MANYVLSRHLDSIGTASCVKTLDILLFTEFIPMDGSTFQRAFYISSAKVPKFAKTTVNQYESPPGPNSNGSIFRQFGTIDHFKNGLELDFQIEWER